MAVKIGHAVNDERGKSRGGQAGDQTGREVYTTDWYKRSKGWSHVLRAKDSKAANKIAAAMEAACANDNIGYDQDERTTLYQQARSKGWDIKAVSAPCETDCSALVAVCVNAAGIVVSKDIYTGNEVEALKATGKFAVYTDASHTDQSDYLKRGDILVGKGHTAVVLTDGARAQSASLAPGKSLDDVAREVIAGKWGTGSGRKSRLESCGYDYNKVQTRVNAIVKGASKTVDQVARDVINGDYGTGTARRVNLMAAGYDYEQVQAKVNDLLKQGV